MLAAQFPLPAQPLIEDAFAGDDHLEWLEGDLLVAFRLVVGIDLLQGLVEDRGERFYRARVFLELDKPLVAPFGLVEQEERGGGVFLDHGARLAASDGDGLVGVVDHQLFAKSVDVVFDASGDHELIRPRGGEADGVADLVAPKAAGGGDEHRVVDARSRLAQGDRLGVLVRDFAHWDELVEDAVIEHEQ